MKSKTSTWIFFFLFLLTASGVFAAMVENSHQGSLAISITSQPGSTENAAESHQGLTCIILNPVSVGAFISKDPIGFNGGNNLYRYADNNPVLFTDPFGLMSPNESRTFRLGNWKVNPEDPRKKDEIPDWQASPISPNTLAFNMGEKCADGCGYWDCDLLLKFREILPNGRHKDFNTSFTENGDQTIIYLPPLDLKFSVGFLTVTCKQIMMP